MASKEAAVIRFLRIRDGFRRRNDDGLALGGCPECFFARIANEPSASENWSVFSFGELAWAACSTHQTRWCVGSPYRIENVSETGARQILHYIDSTFVRAPELGMLMYPAIQQMLEAFVSSQEIDARKHELREVKSSGPTLSSLPYRLAWPITRPAQSFFRRLSHGGSDVSGEE
jgi:hypothetical protein